MRNYTIPKFPEYDENIRMLENTDPADADSVFNPLFSKMINNTAAIRSKFNGVTMKDMEIVNIPNTRDYDYLSLELGGNTRVTPENPDLPISPENVATIESVGDGGNISVVSTDGNLLKQGFDNPDDYFYEKSFTRTGNGYALLIANGKRQNQSIATRTFPILKPDTAYTFLVDIKTNTLNAQGMFGLIEGHNIEVPFLEIHRILPSHIGRMKFSTRTKLNLSKIPYSFNMFMREASTSGNLEFRVMLFEGDVNINTPYQEGIVNIYSIPLKNTDGNTLEPLRSIKDDKGNLVAQDKIIKKDEVWQIERSISIDSYTGNENWVLIDRKENGSFFRFQNRLASALTTSYPIHCTHAPYKGYYEIWEGDEIGAYAHFIDRFIRVPNAIATTEEQFKSWLQAQSQNGTPLKMVYGLGTKIYHPLHPDTQTILNNLEKTYNGTTVIIGTDEISPLITSTYARGSMSTFNAKQISGCEVNDEIIGDRNLLTASKTVALINSMITERLEATR